MTTGTNTPETRSASRWTGALPVCAVSTSRAICASAVSAPTCVARTTRRPPALTVAPATSEPGLHLDRHRLAGQHAHVDGGRRPPRRRRRSRPSRRGEPRSGRPRRAARPGRAARRRRRRGPRRPWRRAPAARSARRPRGAWRGPRSSARRGGTSSRRRRSRGRSRPIPLRASGMSSNVHPHAGHRPRSPRNSAYTRPQPRGEHADGHERVHRRRRRGAGSPTPRGGTARRPRARPAWRGSAPATASCRTAAPGSSRSAAAAATAARR